MFREKHKSVGINNVTKVCVPIGIDRILILHQNANASVHLARPHQGLLGLREVSLQGDVENHLFVVRMKADRVFVGIMGGAATKVYERRSNYLYPRFPSHVIGGGQANVL